MTSFGDLHPDMSAALRRVSEIFQELGPPEPGIEGLRTHLRKAGAWWTEGGPELPVVRPVSIPTAHRKLSGILYQPSERPGLPVYVFLHGGGFRAGGPESNARQLRTIAALWGGAVLSLDYAHIPEATFPVAVEEIAAAYEWLAAKGDRLGVDGTRIAFGGASAGANVSCGAAIALGGIQTGYLRASALIVPVFDGSTDTPSMIEFAQAPYFPTRAETIETWRAYLGAPANDTDPRANLMRAEPALFPPTFLGAAQMDVFRDGATRMAQRLASAGVAHELRNYPGVTHLFFGYSRMVQPASQCIADLATFLRLHLPTARSL